jgi:hypothetical protein
MDDLCNLMEGAKLEKQHVYFNFAKNDINELAKQFYHNLSYDKTKLLLPNYSKYVDYEPEQFKIVVTYINTYGLLFFRDCLQQMNTLNQIFHQNDYDHYIVEYQRELLRE